LPPRGNSEEAKNFSSLVKAALLGSTAGKAIEIWFPDEAGVGQQGSLEYIWAPVGSRPLAVRDNRRDSVYLFGARFPSRATGAAIIMPAVNSEAMSEHLKEIAAQVAAGAHAVLVCDGAGWHQTAAAPARLKADRVPRSAVGSPRGQSRPDSISPESTWESQIGKRATPDSFIDQRALSSTPPTNR